MMGAWIKLRMLKSMFLVEGENVQWLIRMREAYGDVT